MSTALSLKLDTLRTLPTDAARQVQWRFADRYDLHMLVQSARSVARGPVAKLVAQGGRNCHEWTPGKAELLEAFDRSGITAVFMDPEQGGFLIGPRNLALALVAFELAWVDGGAATASFNERRAINLDPNCGWARGKADVLYVADAFQVMAQVNALLAKQAANCEEIEAPLK